MALGNVIIKTTDGNMPSYANSNTERVTGLLFDVSLQPDLFTEGYGKNNENNLTLNDVIQVNNLKSAEKTYGIIARKLGQEEEENNINFFHGLPNYHIREFFRCSGNVDGSGELWVMFADCSSSWDAIDIMQRASGGTISQLGIWTEQPLWKLNGNADTYNLNLVMTLNAKAEAMGDQHQPLNIILCANPSNTGSETSEGKQIDLNKIPSCICESPKISVVFSQAKSSLTSTIQKLNKNHTPVGCIGSILGCLARASVHESIAWVKKFNLYNDFFQDIELGFGDINMINDDEFNSLNQYESLSPDLLDRLDDKGYIFLIKYPGRENGIYISKDQTCSDKDFRTIARNRTIHKSRRAVRNALLPYVNSPLLVNPSNGLLATSKISAFKTLISEILQRMQNKEEISGFAVTIDPNQNVLKDDTLRISYVIVPVGVAIRILVEEGLSLTAK